MDWTCTIFGFAVGGITVGLIIMITNGATC